MTPLGISGGSQEMVIEKGVAVDETITGPGAGGESGQGGQLWGEEEKEQQARIVLIIELAQTGCTWLSAGQCMSSVFYDTYIHVPA